MKLNTLDKLWTNACPYPGCRRRIEVHDRVPSGDNSGWVEGECLTHGTLYFETNHLGMYETEAEAESRWAAEEAQAMNEEW